MGSGIKIFIDDIREKPPEYDFKTDDLAFFIELLITYHEHIDKISFDHDLDGSPLDGFDFAHIARLLVEDGWLDPFEWRVHSANPVGRDRLCHELHKASEAWREQYESRW